MATPEFVPPEVKPDGAGFQRQGGSEMDNLVAVFHRAGSRAVNAPDDADPVVPQSIVDAKTAELAALAEQASSEPSADVTVVEDEPGGDQPPSTDDDLPPPATDAKAEGADAEVEPVVSEDEDDPLVEFIIDGQPRDVLYSEFLRGYAERASCIPKSMPLETETRLCHPPAERGRGCFVIGADARAGLHRWRQEAAGGLLKSGANA